MRVLTTGGLGVIGSHVAKSLHRDGHTVTVIDACEAPRNKWIQGLMPYEVEVLTGRIENKFSNLVDLLGRVDVVIHCAASTGIPYSVQNPSDDWRCNVDATKTLLDALRETPRPMIALSSVKPYRIPDDLGAGLNEDEVLDPDECYAASKAAQSMLCLAYAHSYNLPISVFRCSNLYGPAPCHGPRHGWLTWFAISGAIGRPIEVQGTGDQTRDMLWAEDVYTACMASLQNIGKTRAKVFNIGGGAPNRISVREAAEIISKRTGTPIIKAPARAMDDEHVFVDHTRFTKATGWVPKMDVHQGLEHMMVWAHENKGTLGLLYDKF